jgi:hypothetical protein
MQGDTVQVARGPAAAMVAIKQVGSNGGGFFGVNSSHPLENPSYFTNVLENVMILLIPIAMVFAFGHYLKRKRRLAWMVFGVMTLGFLMLLGAGSHFRVATAIPRSAKWASANQGSMEGKEMRLGLNGIGLLGRDHHRHQQWFRELHARQPHPTQWGHANAGHDGQQLLWRRWSGLPQFLCLHHPRGFHQWADGGPHA